MTAATVRPGTSADLEAICALFTGELEREPNIPLIQGALRDFPSVVATVDGVLVGFAYCGYMAPDLVELMNIAIAAGHRSNGLGTTMLELLERDLSRTAKAVMLTNSTLYTTPGKRAATGFYVRNGYTLVASTGTTDMFWKDL